MPDPVLALNFADGTPMATLTVDQAYRLLDFVENDMVQTDATLVLAAVTNYLREGR